LISALTSAFGGSTSALAFIFSRYSAYFGSLAHGGAFAGSPPAQCGMLSVTVSDNDELIAPHPISKSAATIIKDIETEFLNIDSLTLAAQPK
jgi:hypothetical protein